MKIIPLTQNKKAIVSDKDYKKLSVYKWFYSNGYAKRDIWKNGKNKRIYMHREIAKTPKGMFTDHINFNKLDNRTKNLRVCTKGQNQANTVKRIDNTSGFKGVTWYKRDRKWRAQIGFKGLVKQLGDFIDKVEAAKAYNNAARLYFGKYAIINNINKITI